MNPEITKIINSMPKEKQELFYQGLAETDEINNWPKSGSRHSNHRQPLQTRIMHIRNIVDTLDPKVQKAYIETLIAAGVLPKKQPQAVKKNGPTK